MLANDPVKPGDRFTKKLRGTPMGNAAPIVWVVDRLHDRRPLPRHATLFDLRDRRRQIFVAVEALTNRRYFDRA